MTASIREMGFSEAQARAALVAVRGRSIEMAMEWLFTHPAEAQAADDAERERARSEAAAAENATATGGEETTADDGERGGGTRRGRFRASGIGTRRERSGGCGRGRATSNPSTGVSSPDADAELMRALEMSMAEEEDVDGMRTGRNPRVAATAGEEATRRGGRRALPTPSSSFPPFFTSPSGTRRCSTPGRSC